MQVSLPLPTDAEALARLLAWLRMTVKVDGALVAEGGERLRDLPPVPLAFDGLEGADQRLERGEMAGRGDSRRSCS